MAKTKNKIINKFYGGMVRDEKSKIPGACLNLEEIDIFTNADYIQAEQIFSADAMPASTEIYAKTAAFDLAVYGYGKETSGGKVRIVKAENGGSDNPGDFATVFTSADTTNLAYNVSPFEYFKTDEGDTNFLYYCTKTAANVVKLFRYNMTDAAEEEVGTLSQLNGNYDRISFRVMFGELMITNGKYISKVDKDGVFTEDAFTLPNGWIAVDIIPVSDVGLILARSTNRLANACKGYWWDLTATLQVDDSFPVPFGGPQWIFNHKETIKIFCAQNGKAKFYQLSGAFPGAVPLEIPGIGLTNIADETTTQPISAPKTLGEKDNILYFGVYKTDKTGIYGIGQVDSDKTTALLLAKRFHTSDYSLHKPTSLLIHGANFYADFDDNGTASSARCETRNSPSRSSNAIYESVIIDDGDPTVDKDLSKAFVTTKPLPASTDIDLFVSGDYGSYTEYTRPSGTSLNTTGALGGYFKVTLANKKVFQIKIKLTSSGASSPQVTSIGLTMTVQDVMAFK